MEFLSDSSRAPRRIMNTLTYFTYLILLVSTATSQIVIEDDNTVLVTIKNGKLRGNIIETEELAHPFFAFRGIPFAKPPIAELRFEPPVPAEDWSDIRNATEDADHCIQSNALPSGSEDCLYLNVYTPANNNGSLPVMVWIHGGGFVGGSATYSLYAPDHLLDQDVVFVSVQYRLGIFGFLSTGDMVLPGNAALKDNIMALQWVQDNIAAFGGDANKVTIFGQSSGSAMVSYLLQSKRTEGLFHKAIMQSGTSLSIWSFSRYPKNFAVKIAEKINLHVDPLDSQRLVDDLKAADPFVLQWISISLSGVFLLNDVNNGLYFAPSIEPEHDGAVVTEKSYGLLESGLFNKVPVII